MPRERALSPQSDSSTRTSRGTPRQVAFQSLNYPLTQPLPSFTLYAKAFAVDPPSSPSRVVSPAELSDVPPTRRSPSLSYAWAGDASRTPSGARKTSPTWTRRTSARRARGRTNGSSSAAGGSTGRTSTSSSSSSSRTRTLSRSTSAQLTKCCLVGVKEWTSEWECVDRREAGAGGARGRPEVDVPSRVITSDSSFLFLDSYLSILFSNFGRLSASVLLKVSTGSSLYLS